MLHVIDGEKKRGKERREKEEKKKKKRRKNQLFCYILRPIFVGGACGGLYGRGALAPPHNPSDPTKLALRLISTHYSMLGCTHIHTSRSIYCRSVSVSITNYYTCVPVFLSIGGWCTPCTHHTVCNHTYIHILLLLNFYLLYPRYLLIFKQIMSYVPFASIVVLK